MISSKELAGLSKTEVREHLAIEVEAMRQELNNMTGELKSMMNQKIRRETNDRMESARARWIEKKVMIQNALFPDDDAYMMAS
jgi:hypothetical protein